MFGMTWEAVLSDNCPIRVVYVTTTHTYPLHRFDEYLDLRPYLAHTVSTSQAEDGTQASSIPDDAFDYTLFGVVTHIGTMQQGHYIAYVKQQDQWYKCDDATITMASRAEVLSTQAYLLFYIKSRLEYHTTETMADPDEGPST
eukprot:m.76033 g.76033  ORF g.76033 m.76033 type:complete len:143 (-) comp14420_c0_seq2:134-562(-)